MKVKMLVHFQNTSGIHYEPDQVVEVGAEMAKFLLENRKAVEVKETKPAPVYVPEPEPESVEIPPVQRTRKGRGAK